MINSCLSVTQALANCALPKNEARILMAYVLNWSKTQLITQAEHQLETTQVQQFAALVQRRGAGEPIAQIIGKREFYGLCFNINPHVLIPRPETELLVDTGLKAIQQIDSPMILDLGTGSGAIAISLAKHRPDADIWAVDLSSQALALAEKNAHQLLTQSTIHWHQGSWFSALPSSLRFDLIVSNPPYLSLDDPHLQIGDLRFEPQHALTDHADGFSAIRTIIEQVLPYLKPHASIWIEHGYTQAQKVRYIFQQAGFQHITSHTDLAQIERITGAQLP